MSHSATHSRRVDLGVVRPFDIEFLTQRLTECARTGSVAIEVHTHPDGEGLHVNVDVRSHDRGSVDDFCGFLLGNLCRAGTDGTNVSNWTTRYIERVVRFCEWVNARRAAIHLVAGWNTI